jgi:hypothetical protein
MQYNDMPTAGLEPAHLTAPDPKSCARRGDGVQAMHFDRGNAHSDGRVSTTELTTRRSARRAGVGLVVLALAGCVPSNAKSDSECHRFLAVAQTVAESTAAWGTVPYRTHGYNCFERLRAGLPERAR